MITAEFRKKMADSWFSYLQTQICKEFEYLENNKVKFFKRDWNKDISLPNFIWSTDNDTLFGKE